MPSLYRVWRAHSTGSFYLSYILVSLYTFILTFSHIMRIISFGDSFTAGFNKSADGSRRWFITPFIKIIADRLNADFHNHAEPGNSNQKIATQLARWIKNDNYTPGDLLFIGWSGPLRHSKWQENYGWENDKSGSDIITEQERLWTSQYAIRGTENLLRNNGIPHIMTGAFITPEYVKEEKWQCWIESNHIRNTLMDICTEEWLQKDAPKRSQSWIFNNKKQKPTEYLNECLHPNERGHARIADILYPYIAETIMTGDGIQTFAPKHVSESL